MKNPTKRAGYFATAAATETSSPGMLAMSTLRATHLSIELRDPAIRERVGSPRRLPPETGGNGVRTPVCRKVGQILRQDFEETRGEEMAVAVAESHG